VKPPPPLKVDLPGRSPDIADHIAFVERSVTQCADLSRFVWIENREEVGVGEAAALKIVVLLRQRACELMGEDRPIMITNIRGADAIESWTDEAKMKPWVREFRDWIETKMMMTIVIDSRTSDLHVVYATRRTSV
jgi:hypothetical protein